MSKKVVSPQAMDSLIKDIESAWDVAMKQTLRKDEGEDEDSDAPAAPEQGAADQQGAPAAPAAGQADPAAAGQDPNAAGAEQGAGQEGVPPGAEQGAEGQDPNAQGADQGAGAEGQGEPGQDGDQQLEQEGQAGAEGELSDEELQQIYGSMDPQELERHYMVLRGILRDQYQKAEGGIQDDPSAVAASKVAKSETPMNKSEKATADKFKKLEAENDELKKSVDALLKATKIMIQPTRKAATTEIEFINKSEGGSNTPKAAETLNLSKAEIKEKVGTLCKTNHTLTKSERDLCSRYIVNGSNESEVLKLIGAKK